MFGILTKRMMSELKEAHSVNIEKGGYGGVYLIQKNEDDIMNLKGLIIGPDDSVYQGGFFLFDIEITNQFPINPPKYKFVSPQYTNNIRIHPNLYQGGKVCLSILNTWGGPEWTPVTRNVAILHTIQSLLDQDPIIHEPGVFSKDQHKNYIEAVKYLNIVMAYDIYIKRQELHPVFEEKIHYFFNKYRNDYVKTLSKMTNGNIRYYHGTICIDKESMIRKIESA